jgi:hypothetical protein
MDPGLELLLQCSECASLRHDRPQTASKGDRRRNGKWQMANGILVAIMK